MIRSSDRRERRAFTLIELVVVVLILGILSAVAIPRLVARADAATDAGISQSLAVIRDAIECYAAEHGGTLPGASGTEKAFVTEIAPYLRGMRIPVCPVGAKNDRVRITSSDTVIAGEEKPVEAWHYNCVTGEFIVNFSGETTIDGLHYDDL